MVRHRTSLGAITLSALFLVAGASPGAPTRTSREETADAAAIASRMRDWETGNALLDAGRNAAAAEQYRRCLESDPCRLEAADRLIRALSRDGHADSGLTLLALIAPAKGCPLASFREGLRLQVAQRHGDAAIRFRAARDSCAAAGDDLAAEVAAIQLAQSLCRVPDLDAAEAALRTPREIISAPIGGDRARAEAVVVLADIRNLGRRQEEADSLYDEAFAIADAHGYRQVRSQALNGKGSLRSQNRQVREAIGYFNRALDDARILSDRMLCGLLLINLAYEETQIREMDAATRHLEEALRLTAVYRPNPHRGMIESGFGAIAEASGRRDEAIARFRSAVDELKAVGNTRGELGAR